MPVSDETRDACMSYVGKQRHQHDTMAPEPARNLAIVLNTECPDKLPPTWHWGYFASPLRPEDTGHDGHERLGLFMPPAPFDRRMWAAGRIELVKPLEIGTPAEKTSTIASVAFKDGKSGPLCFVEVDHEIRQKGNRALLERQIIVYRDRGLVETALRGPDDPVPDGYRVFPDTQLIAYSAILQNGHRIHWDRDFCQNVEGYPGLVVHGPLLATILADALVGGFAPCKFSYRATAPVFETSPVKVQKDGNSATIKRSDGVVAMKASVSD